MGPNFIISFDCEGKWGLADNPDESLRAHLTNSRLNYAYRKIIDLLTHYEIKGTFAFVGAFTLSIEEYYSNQEWFSDCSETVKRWLWNFRQDIKKGNFEGWFNPEPIRMVTQAKDHEIGAHGFSHIPLGEDLMTKEGFFREMDLLMKVPHFKGREGMTFIYPRNIVGYREELAGAGFIGYRDRLHLSRLQNIGGIRSEKIMRFASELNLLTEAQSHSKNNDLVRIPAGYFLNWRHSLRKTIPLGFTIKKWEHIILDAVKNNKVAHLWTHPHNFITGDSMYFLLEEILKIVDRFIKEGCLTNVTQKEYIELLA